MCLWSSLSLPLRKGSTWVWSTSSQTGLAYCCHIQWDRLFVLGSSHPANLCRCRGTGLVPAYSNNPFGWEISLGLSPFFLKAKTKSGNPARHQLESLTICLWASPKALVRVAATNGSFQMVILGQW